jgi:glycosyltransferase involved in cell wall biosynthesis
MQDSNVLLSICIPTYNRAIVFSKCLRELCPIAVKYNIPVYISDNASTDNTEEIVNDFSRQYNNIIYFKQKENIGADRNVEFILKQADTKYRWLLSDQVKITEKAIKDLVLDLDKNEYTVYVINSTIRRAAIFFENIYTEKNHLLDDIGWHMTYISSLIYNADLIADTNFSHYYGSRFLQTGIIFEYCASHEFYVKMNPYICISLFESDFTDHWSRTMPFEVFAKDWFLFVMSLPVGFSFERKRKCILDHGIKSEFFSFFHLCYLRMNKLFSIKILCQYKYFIIQTIPYPLILLFILACMPIKILVLLRWIRRYIKNRIVHSGLI